MSEVAQESPKAARMDARAWRAVFASLLGLTGSGSVLVSVFGLLVGPVSASFGWSRGLMSSALGVSGLVGAACVPIVGYITDRWGARSVVLPCIVLFALAMGSIGLLNGSVTGLFVVFIVAQIFGAGQSPLPYSRVISGWFDTRRGIALGVGIAGTGLGAIIVPPLMGAAIGAYGWRAGCSYLGIGIFLVAFPAVYLFLHDSPLADVRTVSSDDLRGLSVKEAVRTWRFWAILIALFCMVVAVHGVVTHGIPLMEDRGIAPGAAIAALSSVGILTVLARLLAGWCLDRLNGRIVAGIFLGITLVGLFLLTFGTGQVPTLVGIALCGVTIGTEADLIAYYVGRYFGLKAFGRIYGFIFPMVPVGVGAGTAMMGTLFDHTHSYRLPLGINTGLLAAAIVILSCLGPYRFERALR